MDSNHMIDLNMSLDLHEDLLSNEEIISTSTSHNEGRENFSQGHNETHSTQCSSHHHELDLNRPPSPECEVGADDGQVNVKKRKVMTNSERQAVYAALLKASVNGKLKKYSTKKVATKFEVPLRTVQRIWKRAKENVGNDFADVSHRWIKNCGRKRI
ncbi:hypothetical protein DCAR_0830610 [Daucus carota subsp. sativus]|uniref:DUF7769 domain-containing protein n=1 Tax=Daucus carota subsp. sativus TaxID=79200 RepID=A0AAF0XR67_DAUCS|nr:PREDICTED: uncharacterized protein LOC108199080 [Daucus carota subsp. sativus]WOH11131.1 hypothetical protein DCAR_0830610 [Daucus carota subsp. sativus]